MRTIDAYLTLNTDGVEVTVRLVEADADALTFEQQLAAELIASICDTGRPANAGDTTPPTPLTCATDGTDTSLERCRHPEPCTVQCDGIPAPVAPPLDLTGTAQPDAAPSPQGTVVAHQTWPHPKRPPAGTKGTQRDSARTRVMAMLSDGPVAGTLDELATEVDCSYGAMRQLLTKAVAAGTIQRTTVGRVLTLSIPGDTRPPISVGTAA